MTAPARVFCMATILALLVFTTACTSSDDSGDPRSDAGSHGTHADTQVAPNDADNDTSPGGSDAEEVEVSTQADAHVADAHVADAHGADAHGADAHGADAHGADAHGAGAESELPAPCDEGISCYLHDDPCLRTALCPECVGGAFGGEPSRCLRRCGRFPNAAGLDVVPCPPGYSCAMRDRSGLCLPSCECSGDEVCAAGWRCARLSLPGEPARSGCLPPDVTGFYAVPCEPSRQCPDVSGSYEIAASVGTCGLALAAPNPQVVQEGCTLRFAGPTVSSTPAPLDEVGDWSAASLSIAWKGSSNAWGYGRFIEEDESIEFISGAGDGCFGKLYRVTRNTTATSMGKPCGIAVEELCAPPTHCASVPFMGKSAPFCHTGCSPDDTWCPTGSVCFVFAEAGAGACVPSCSGGGAEGCPAPLRCQPLDAHPVPQPEPARFGCVP